MISLQEFREIAVAMKQVANPTADPNNKHPGECVSLIQLYLSLVFGIAYAPRGHAKDFVPPTFKRLSADSKLMPGDIVRYGRPFGVINGVVYGHIGLIVDDGRFMDQNGVASRAVGLRGAPWAQIEAVFRPTRSFALKKPKPASKPKPTPVVRRSKAGRAVVVATGLNVRSAPSTNNQVGKVVAQYKKGQAFLYDSYIDAGGLRWLSYISYSGARRYVAQRKGNIKYVTGGV